eukprot:GHVR01167550.1.p1 GENE.GHVR01167550.1~~GHVR01167550.1.p1  ORF type:complete len:247 (+),score=72.81 GHVR01167550.1:64-804(+)
MGPKKAPGQGSADDIEVNLFLIDMLREAKRTNDMLTVARKSLKGIITASLLPEHEPLCVSACDCFVNVLIDIEEDMYKTNICKLGGHIKDDFRHIHWVAYRQSIQGRADAVTGEFFYLVQEKLLNPLESRIEGALEGLREFRKQQIEHEAALLKYDEHIKILEQQNDETTEINEKTTEINEKTTEINEKTTEINEKTTEINEKTTEINEKTTTVKDVPPPQRYHPCHLLLNRVPPLLSSVLILHML